MIDLIEMSRHVSEVRRRARLYISEARFPEPGRCKRSSTSKNQEWSGINPVDRSVCLGNKSGQVYPGYCAHIRAAAGHEAGTAKEKECISSHEVKLSKLRAI
jgi:hypothetical protein